MTTDVAILTFDETLFRAQCPAFANTTQYPTVYLQMLWDTATCYVSDVGNFGSLQGSCRQYALNLMVAHLAYQGDLTVEGTTPYVLGAATIDKVQITAVPPPLKNQWGWWLSTSVYGQQLWALLQVKSAGGIYVGGSPVLSSFRGYGDSGYAVPN